jgi:hypothetical protein
MMYICDAAGTAVAAEPEPFEGGGVWMYLKMGTAAPAGGKTLAIPWTTGTGTLSAWGAVVRAFREHHKPRKYEE